MSNIQALDWILDFMESKNIPYLICGGLGAIAYGSTRPLNDIDLYVPEEHYAEIVRFGRGYISFGPERVHNERWNVDYVQFIYKGKKIEVGSSDNIEIFVSKTQKWFHKKLNFKNYTLKRAFGRLIRVMTKEQLIEYKEMLNREVDRIDIEQISIK